MRIASFLKTGIGIALMAGALLGAPGCGPDYALFRVHVTSTNTSHEKRDQVSKCVMTITNESGGVVLDQYYLQPLRRDGTLVQGCSPGEMVSDVATFDYSTSRKSGTLTFRVDAMDDNFNTYQTGESAPIAVKPYPPEIEVSFAIK